MSFAKGATDACLKALGDESNTILTVITLAVAAQSEASLSYTTAGRCSPFTISLSITHNLHPLTLRPSSIPYRRFRTPRFTFTSQVIGSKNLATTERNGTEREMDFSKTGHMTERK